MKKQTEKTSIEKAKSGQLLVNTSDIDNMLSRNVNFMPTAPMAAKDCDGAEAFTQSFFKASTRVSSNKKNCSHDDAFTFMAFAMMMNNTLRSLTPVYTSAPEYNHS